MENYRIIKPSPLLEPYIKYYWFLQADGISGDFQRVTPTGSIEMIFHRGNKMFSVNQNNTQPQSFICGQKSDYYDLKPTGKIDMITVIFKPHAAKAFFKLPMNELSSKYVSLADLNNKDLIGLEQKLHETDDDYQCISLIEQFLLKRLQSSDPYNLNRAARIIKTINQGETNIKTLSDNTFLSYKQFQRVFAEYIGSNPKEFLRVVRFQKALLYLQYNPEMSLTHLAMECDFYDQSHLIREFKTFSGFTPREYIAECPPFSDYFYMC